MLQSYFRALYQDAIGRAYELAFDRIAASLTPEARVLDCGASSGTALKHLEARVRFSRDQYSGLEWSAECVARGQAQGLDIRQGDLNRGLPYADASYSCIYGLSLLEHLLNPCRFLKDCHRVLRPGGELVLLTPNISTYFTAVLILMGKMPSSGPHPDSDLLIKREEIFKVSPDEHEKDTEGDTPVHRHLVVFSYRVLRDYLRMLGFSQVSGHGFGLYPFPQFSQPLLERIDPYHCHQMVFVARK